MEGVSPSITPDLENLKYEPKVELKNIEEFLTQNKEGIPLDPMVELNIK